MAYDRDGEIVNIGDTVKVESSKEFIHNGLISTVYDICKHTIFIGGGSVDDGYPSEHEIVYRFVLHYPDKNFNNGYREMDVVSYFCKKID